MTEWIECKISDIGTVVGGATPSTKKAENYEGGNISWMVDDREVLQDAGKITAEIAKAKAETEFEKYRVVQDRLFISDFDKYMLELKENVKK